MPEHYNLGPYSRKITTSSPEAQRWFDRGLNWCFGYHHEEAIACWKKALEYDTSCAMAYWGIAYATGPNYNMPGIYTTLRVAHVLSEVVGTPSRPHFSAPMASHRLKVH